MRRVSRPETAPDSLTEKGAAELTKAKAYYGATPKPTKAYEFKEYKQTAVKLALETLFHGKCAYCETFYASAQPMDVEHYRPKGGVDEDKSHPGYWWLAMDWDNLLPSCIDCNRKRGQKTATGAVNGKIITDRLKNSGKKDSFPISPKGTRATKEKDILADEKALLLNPCTDDPRQHLKYYFGATNSIALMQAATIDPETSPDFVEPGKDFSLKGARSIQIYGLNRLALVQARTAVLLRFEFLQTLAEDLVILGAQIRQQGAGNTVLLNAAEKVEDLARRIAGEMKQMADPKAPFAAMVAVLIAQYKATSGP